MRYAARFGNRLQRISWAVIDQALFAGSNFLIGLLSARWMPTEEFGAFATALAVSVLLISAYEALFSEPMMVFGSGRYQDVFRRYLGGLLVGQIPFALLGAGVLLLASFLLAITGEGHISGALFALGIVSPMILLRFLLRAACYASQQPRVATMGGIVYSATLIAGFGLITITFGVSYTAVFGVMASAAVASAFTAAWFIRPARADWALLHKIRQEHWQYGRWSVSTTIVQWLPGNIWFLLLPLWAGLEGNAALRALANLNLALAHLMTAVGMLLLPILVRAHASSSERFQRVSILATIGVGTLCLGYWAIVTVFGESIVSLMYAGKYTEYAHHLAILGLSPLLYGITIVYGGRARAVEKPEIIFRAALAGLLPVAPGIGLTYYYGLSGAIISQLLVQATVMIVLVRATRGEVSMWSR